MRLLLITQKVDRKDTVLSFMHEWIAEFSRRFDRINVVCLYKGDFDLPGNVAVRSLGKEEGKSRLDYISTFFRHISSLRNEYDGVFVHMNSEYVILAGLFWKLWGKKVVLWYNHSQRGLRLWIAMLFADVVCHTSPYSASAGRGKSRQMPVGVDTDAFTPNGVARYKNTWKVLSLGRIAPIKNIQVMLDAIEMTTTRGNSFQLTVVGSALPKDKGYLEILQSKAARIPLNGAVTFLPGESDRKKVAALFNSHDIFLNASPSGLFDKAVFEAMACGCIPVVSSRAFKDLLPPECIFAEKDAASLAGKLQGLQKMPIPALQKLATSLRERVVKEHSLTKLADEIKSLYD